MMVPIDLTPEEIGEWVCEMRECFAELTPIPPILMQKVGEAIGRDAKA